MRQVRDDIPGTRLFDGRMARRGYALNMMCFSFNDPANRAAFVADDDAYCARYGLDAGQREAILKRNVLQLLAAGGNACHLAKFAGIAPQAGLVSLRVLEADGRGRIKVNACYQTEVSHIYAAGDVIGFPALASTSMEQGRLAACHAFGVPFSEAKPLYPFGVYAIPEVAWVGATEAELTAKGIPFETGVARYKEIARGQILGDPNGMLKLIFGLETKEILGVWGIGSQATELVHIGQAVMLLGGTLDYFVTTVFNYPTLAECYKVAALDGYNKIYSLGDSVPAAGPEAQPVATP